MNGQEKGAEYFEAFTRWASDLTDSDARSIVHGGQLNRGEICRAIGCGRAVLYQNTGVKEALAELEAGLRRRGVLPAAAVGGELPFRHRSQVQQITDAERLKQLESENASLRAATAELRKRLARFEAIEAHLAATGRLAR